MEDIRLVSVDEGIANDILVFWFRDRYFLAFVGKDGSVQVPILDTGSPKEAFGNMSTMVEVMGMEPRNPVAEDYDRFGSAISQVSSRNVEIAQIMEGKPKRTFTVRQ